MDFINPLISAFKGYCTLEKIMFMAWIFVSRWSWGRFRSLWPRSIL